MDKAFRVMDYSNITDIPTYRDEKFRIPSHAEEQLGLWVDRIGKQTTSKRPERLRILGQYCFIYVLKGTGIYLSKAAGCLNVSEGDCMLQLPEDPCLYYPHGSWTTCWVTWNGPEGKILKELGCINPRHAVFPDPEAAALDAYAALSPIIHNEEIGTVLKRKSIVLEMIRKGQKAAQSTTSWQGDNHEPMEHAVAWLHERYTQDIRIPDLAAELHMSAPHLRRRFRAYTGRSPTEFVRSLRMAESKRLLREGVPIKQVAEEVGYKDVFYFMRVFKKAVGMPPGKFQHFVPADGFMH